MSRMVTGAVLAWFGTVGWALAQAGLPVVDDVDLEAFGGQYARLGKALMARQAPLPGETHQKVQALLSKGTGTPGAAAEQIQQLLDAHCLVAIAINPESRVKAARGPARAELRLGRDTFLLIKVANEAGVTHALTVSGPQLRGSEAKDGGRWLEAAVDAGQPLAATLSGQRLEYVVLRLKAHEAGKREATLKFDVGQGTQDLGFRAEVPILFTVRPRE
jgi:hypothetical protein